MREGDPPASTAAQDGAGLAYDEDMHGKGSPSIEPDPVIEAYKKDIDRTLLRESLKLTVTQRIQRLMEMQKLAKEMRRAGREAQRSQ